MEAEGDGQSLGLLLEMRALCQAITEQNDRFAYEAHKLLQRLANPNLHGLDEKLSYRVVQREPEFYGANIRLIAACGNLTMGHVALKEAIRQDPRSGWILLSPGRVCGRYDPPGVVPNEK